MALDVRAQPAVSPPPLTPPMQKEGHPPMASRYSRPEAGKLPSAGRILPVASLGCRWTMNYFWCLQRCVLG